MNKQNQKGITLIALIITIIVMLILVGVTINVALNGGLFGKAEEATTKTKIAQVKEALAIKKAELVADNDGVEPEYSLSINDLSLPAELKTEYGSKLKISKDGILYYDASIVTSKEEQDLFKTMGIEEYVETNVGTSANSYTFTIANLVDRGLLGTNGMVQATSEEFWPEDISEELKSSTITKKLQGNDVLTYNVDCLNLEYVNILDLQDQSPPKNSYILYLQEEHVLFVVFGGEGGPITSENYANYADLTFTISMPE